MTRKVQTIKLRRIVRLELGASGNTPEMRHIRKALSPKPVRNNFFSNRQQRNQVLAKEGDFTIFLNKEVDQNVRKNGGSALPTIQKQSFNKNRERIESYTTNYSLQTPPSLKAEKAKVSFIRSEAKARSKGLCKTKR